MEISVSELLPAIVFKASRSGGKGGQNVNKVSTKVELSFDLEKSAVFSAAEKEIIRAKLISRINAAGAIKVTCEEERSQLLNKDRCLEKLLFLLKSALIVRKARKATKPKKAAIERRLKDKQQQAVKKLNRRRDL